MRPSAYLVGVLTLIVVSGVFVCTVIEKQRGRYLASWPESVKAVRVFGLSDLALSTEARYTRHPAVSDMVAPFMNHPEGLEHFPSGSFFAPREK